MTPICDKYSYFLDKYEFIDQLEEGDKIYKDGDKILVQKQSYLQGLTRYFFCESRDTAIKYLTDLHEEYFKFLNELVQHIEKNNNDDLKLLVSRIQVFNERIIISLTRLSMTYNNEFDPLKKLIQLMDNIFRVFTFKITLLYAKKDR